MENQYLEMELAIHGLSFRIDELKSVRAISVHEPITIGSATIAKQEGHLVSRFRTESDEVPKHIGVLFKCI